MLFVNLSTGTATFRWNEQASRCNAAADRRCRSLGWLRLGR